MKNGLNSKEIIKRVKRKHTEFRNTINHSYVKVDKYMMWETSKRLEYEK